VSERPRGRTDPVEIALRLLEPGDEELTFRYTDA
jgi:hypothetical protein